MDDEDTAGGTLTLPAWLAEVLVPRIGGYEPTFSSLVAIVALVHYWQGTILVLDGVRDFHAFLGHSDSYGGTRLIGVCARVPIW